MKMRLSLLYFLQFSVWGCYLTCFGQLLGAGGLGSGIAWFYAAIGLVSILTPPLMGRLADHTGKPDTLLALCHLGASVAMFLMWIYAAGRTHLEFHVFYPLYLLFLALYMPTMALANTLTFGMLARAGRNPVTAFPSIRIWGTIGFVAAMWFVNSAWWDGTRFGFAFNDESDAGHLRFQYNAMQLFCAGVAGLIVAGYVFLIKGKRIPLSAHNTEVSGQTSDGKVRHTLASSFRKILGRETALFLIFAILAGVCMQISNGFATPYITHFTGMAEYAGSLASGNATMLFSLSQISEGICILLVGLSMKRYGMKAVYAAGLIAWSLRFLLLGEGNPGSGLWMLVASMIIYGIAFNFVTIAGHLYIQQKAPEGMKGFAQGLIMFMSNGIGATFGTLAAGRIVNGWCEWELVTIPGSGTQMRLFMGDWEIPWLIFATYAAVVALAWLLLFRNGKRAGVSPDPEEISGIRKRKKHD